MIPRGCRDKEDFGEVESRAEGQNKISQRLCGLCWGGRNKEQSGVAMLADWVVVKVLGGWNGKGRWRVARVCVCGACRCLL